MRNPRTQQHGAETGVSPYLHDYAERLKNAGVDARVPHGRPVLPDALELDGKPLSEVVRQMREDG